MSWTIKNYFIELQIYFKMINIMSVKNCVCGNIPLSRESYLKVTLKLP